MNKFWEIASRIFQVMALAFMVSAILHLAAEVVLYTNHTGRLYQVYHRR